MIINVINLSHRNDRRISLVEHLTEMGCLYRFWEGFKDRDKLPYTNISNSHKQIVKDAKARKLPFVIIAEDDLRFSCDRSLSYFFSQIPSEYDLFFGCIFTGVIQDGRITSGFSGLQFYIIHEKFYNTFLSAPPTKHLDMWLGERCHEHQYYCVDPFVCYGESGYSDNFKRQWMFKEENLPRKLLR